MRNHLDRIFAVATVVVVSFGTALVISDYLDPEAAILALAVALFASTATAWTRPRE